MNFSNRSFVGGSGACDFQAFYAAYYTFSSMGLAAYGLASTFYIASSTTPKWAVVGGAGAFIHIMSIIVACLPFAGAGSYLFAKDYCMHDIEGGFFSALFLFWYFCCVAAMVGSIVWLKCLAKKIMQPEATLSYKLQQLTALLWFLASYFIVFAWSVSIVIALAWIANGAVYDSSAWRLYGTQAIILHSNQLFVPLLFGGIWRYRMLDIAAPQSQSHAGADSEKISMDTPAKLGVVSA
jgi:hypothetical protein